jgi:hypothetical protein
MQPTRLENGCCRANPSRIQDSYSSVFSEVYTFLYLLVYLHSYIFFFRKKKRKNKKSKPFACSIKINLTKKLFLTKRLTTLVASGISHRVLCRGLWSLKANSYSSKTHYLTHTCSERQTPSCSKAGGFRFCGSQNSVRFGSQDQSMLSV